ncbi:MAG: hypothetical protein AB9888_13550 [Bacteroidales bacterium]
MSTLRQKISEHLFNIPGWKTNRRIIVFESDDWGSIRMPSRNVYEDCLKHGYRVDSNIFSRYDSLASEEDLTLLFDLLLSFKDSAANHPIITANCLVANPDFRKISENGFNHYYYEPITETFKKYPKHNHCFELWQEGLRLRIFKPQSHGREHLNVSRFMHDLKSGDKDALFAFSHNMPGIFKRSEVQSGNKYILSLDHYDARDRDEKIQYVKEGLKLFRELFHYSSESFIASNYIWDPLLEKGLSEMGVRYIQGSKYQNIPKGTDKGFKSRYHFLGEKNSMGQIYLTRNVYFEPALNMSSDWFSSALRQIDAAFKWHRPAIISMHRINFVGFIDQGNRDRTLVLLKDLLKRIIKLWPDVEFLSSDNLGDLIASKEL